MLFSTFTTVPDKPTDQSPTLNQRLPWLDAAKAYGMFLVYYGHFVEKIAKLQSFSIETIAFSHFKFIYAFHMPLFFVLSGLTYTRKEKSLLLFLYEKFLTRILPAIFFNLLPLGIEFLKSSVNQTTSIVNLYSLREILIKLFTGYPFGNFITWFLFCLFTVELLNYIIYPLVQNNIWKRFWIAVITLIAGYYLARHQSSLSSLPLRGINTWYFNTALIGFSFYQGGFILKQSEILLWFQTSFYKYIVLGITLTATLFLFELNQGPFSHFRSIVVMAFSSYGNLFFFSITAITGTLFIIFLSLSLPHSQYLAFIGKHTLVLLGLNFFFIDFTQPIVRKIGLSVFDHWLPIWLLCTGLTLGSFIICIPVIDWLHRFLPQLVGQPTVQGPLLPVLLRKDQ